MAQQPDGIGDLGLRSFHGSSSAFSSDQRPEHPDNRPPTGSTNDIPPTSGGGATIDELTTSDIVIAVMGSTGAGKSTFINMASGTQQATVGHSLTSCTQDIQQISYVDEGRGARVVLVDTPGFDDTNLTDLEILRRIAEWLKETHGQGILLSGILIFHRISDNRMGGSPVGTMKMFQDLCGKDALSNVMLVTTMWDEVDPDLGQQHEEELRYYWQPMLAEGARMLRFRHSEASAHAIISNFRGCRRSLLIQDQMKKGNAWYETSAATRLFGPLAKLIKKILDLIGWLDHRIRKEKDPAKRSKLARRKELRESSLSGLIDTRQPPPSIGSSLQRCLSAPSPRRLPPIATTLLDTVLGDELRDSPTSLRGSGLRRSVALHPSPARSHDSLAEQVEALRRLYDLIPVSTIQDTVQQMLSIIEIIEQLEPSDESIVPLVERTGLLTIVFAGRVQGQPSIDNVKHTVDQFKTVLSQMLDQLQTILSRHHRARQPAAHLPDTVHQCSTNTAELTDVPQAPLQSGGRGSPDSIPKALLDTVNRMETLLQDLQFVPRNVNILGGSFFDIQGDYITFPGLSPPDLMREMVPNPQLRRHSSPSPGSQRHTF